MREGCFDELAERAPGTTGEDDLGSVDGCVAQAANAALAAVRPAYRDVLLLRDVHGLDTPALAAVADIGESDVEHLLYRARAEFASAFATLPAGSPLPGESRARGVRRLRRAGAAARDADARAPATRAPARAGASPGRLAPRSQRRLTRAAGTACGAHHRPQEPRGGGLVERLVEVAALRRLHAGRAAALAACTRPRSRAASATRSSKRSTPRRGEPDAAGVAVVDEDRRRGRSADGGSSTGRRCPSGRTSRSSGSTEISVCSAAWRAPRRSPPASSSRSSGGSNQRACVAEAPRRQVERHDVERRVRPGSSRRW